MRGRRLLGVNKPLLKIQLNVAFARVSFQCAKLLAEVSLVHRFDFIPENQFHLSLGGQGWQWLGATVDSMTADAGKKLLDL